MLRKVAIGFSGFLLLLLLVFTALPFFLPVNETALSVGYKPFANSRLIKVNNITLHYRVWPALITDSSRGTLFLIHGFSGSTFSWRKNADKLAAAGYNVVAVDLPGFGYSDRAQGLNHSATYNAQLCWQLLDSLQPGPYVLCGHSMGGGVAAAMACARPQRCSKLVLIDGALMSTNNGKQGGWTTNLFTSSPVKRWAEVLGKKYFLNKDKIGELLASAYATEPDSEAIAGYLQPLLFKNTAGCILDMAASKETTTVEPAKIKTPVVAIWGSSDTWVPYKNMEPQLKKFAQLKTYFINSAGHCPMETHAVEVNRLLIKELGK